VICHQQEDGPDHRDEQAPNVQPVDPGHSEETEKAAAKYRARDADAYIQENTIAVPINYFAADKAGSQAQNHPRQKLHLFSNPFSQEVNLLPD
jgi:hypothetical protein